MIVLLLLQLSVLVLSQPDDPSGGLESRILYGQSVKIEDYPFYAGLNNCGAAIISDVWVLTAGHCVADVDPRSKNYIWVGGETFSNSQKVPYNKVIIHEEYKSIQGLPINDVALVRLASPLQFSKKVRAVKLPSPGFTSSRAIFVGRGIDETGKMSKHLQKLDLVRLTSDQCISLIPKQYQSFARKNIKFLEKNNICAKRDSDMPSICNGDSGSPLVNGDTVVGLASYIGGQKCSQLRLGFYVNVATYTPWIKAKTGLQI